MVWIPEPTYDKPDISVRATTLYYEIVAKIMLPFISRRLFQRNREHPPTGKEFDRLVHFEPVEQKNGRTEDYLYLESAEAIAGCAKVQTMEFPRLGQSRLALSRPRTGWSSISTPIRCSISQQSKPPPSRYAAISRR